MPSFNYGGTSLPSQIFCGKPAIRALLKNGVWGASGAITGHTCTAIGTSSSAAVDFYVGLNRMPLGVAADSTVNFLIEHIWEVNIADETCLHCSPCPCDSDMMAPMTSGAGTGKTQTTGTRWGPDGEDQTGAWYSGNTQYTRLGVGGVNN